LDLQPGEAKQFPLSDNLTVTAIGAPHMGPQYAAVKHHCFLLTIAGKHLLFTGDADHVPEYFVPALNGINPDVVFVNPLFYHHANGRKIINEIFRPRTVVIYHMPFAKDDTTQLSHVVERDIKRYGQNGIQSLIFSQEKQRLYLRG
jgi:L-ascorbate metabolism protein UlaG (beta-lactamase superfamily)